MKFVRLSKKKDYLLVKLVTADELSSYKHKADNTFWFDITPAAARFAEKFSEGESIEVKVKKDGAKNIVELIKKAGSGSAKSNVPVDNDPQPEPEKEFPKEEKKSNYSPAKEESIIRQSIIKSVGSALPAFAGQLDPNDFDMVDALIDHLYNKFRSIVG
jgi:hypothetical protein